MDTKAHEWRQADANAGEGSRGVTSSSGFGSNRVHSRWPNRLPRAGATPTRRRVRAFTLIEVLASLLFMAIVIPVVMQGVSVASRAGIMGQRKAAAIRVAERMLDEIIVTGETNQANASGTITEGDATYTWSMESQPWSEDAMTEMSVKVTFTVQGNEYNVSATTLYDPTMAGMAPDSQ